MAIHSAYHASISLSAPLKCFGAKNRKFKPFRVQFSSITNTARTSYNSLVSEAVRLLVPPAIFEASKLNVVFMGKGLKGYSAIIPRTYIFSHCDFIANLTLTISNVIDLDQLKGWYNNDDVVAEWKKVKETMFLNVHCFVSGPNLSLDLAAEFRYHIFSKELPLVLKAVLHGDSALFAENPELMNALVCVYFHSSLLKYNRIECWGLLKEAAEGKPGDRVQGMLTAEKKVHHQQQNGKEVQHPSSKHCLPFFFDLLTGQVVSWPHTAATKTSQRRDKRINNTIKEKQVRFQDQKGQPEQSIP